MLKVLAELKVCLRAFSVASVVFSSVTPWTVTHQAPLSVGFSRQEYWNWLPRPPPRDLPDPGIEPGSLTSPAVVDCFLSFFSTSTTSWEAPKLVNVLYSP